MKANNIILLCVFVLPQIASSGESQNKGIRSASAPPSITLRETSDEGSPHTPFATQNFRVQAPTPRLAREVGQAAERYRQMLATSWFGRQLPDWNAPCLIRVLVGHSPTATIKSNSDEWEMAIQGARSHILESSLPRGVLQLLFASHFEQRAPLWAVEGAGITVETMTEQAQHDELLVRFLTSNRGIAFNRLFAFEEYPSDVLPMLSQSHSVVHFLVNQHGRRGFVAFLEDGIASGDWDSALLSHYEFADASALQLAWTQSVNATHFEDQ